MPPQAPSSMPPQSPVFTPKVCSLHRHNSGKPVAAAAKPSSLPSARPALSSLMDDDWMFGCQKPLAEPTNPPAKPSATPEGQNAPPAVSLPPSTRTAGAGSNDRQLLTADGQSSPLEGQTTCPHGQQGGTTTITPWTMSVPALRSSISFANALPPVPVGFASQQAQSRDGASNIHTDQRKASHQHGAAAAVGGRSLTAQQQVRASVSDWLLRQGSGGVQEASCHDSSGDCLVELATGEEDERSQASCRSGASDDGAAELQVTPSCFLFFYQKVFAMFVLGNNGIEPATCAGLCTVVSGVGHNPACLTCLAHTLHCVSNGKMVKL